MRAGGISGRGRALPLVVLMLCVADGRAEVGTGGAPSAAGEKPPGEEGDGK